MPRRAEDADPKLAATIRAQREAQGRSQEDVAHAARMTTGSYARVERGRSSPSWVTVRAIAKALGLTMSELARAVERRR